MSQHGQEFVLAAVGVAQRLFHVVFFGGVVDDGDPAVNLFRAIASWRVSNLDPATSYCSIRQFHFKFDALAGKNTIDKWANHFVGWVADDFAKRLANHVLELETEPGGAARTDPGIAPVPVATGHGHGHVVRHYFELFLGGAQFVGRALALADVTRHLRCANDLAAGVLDWPDRQGNVQAVAILGDAYGLKMLNALAALQALEK